MHPDDSGWSRDGDVKQFIFLMNIPSDYRNALYDKLRYERMISQRSEWNAMGEKSYQLFQDRFSLDKIARDFIREISYKYELEPTVTLPL
jgi:hypothetical protein